MVSTRASYRVFRSLNPLSCLCLVAVLAWASAGQAAPPVSPLPVAEYSFDLASPTVTTGFVDSDDVLVLAHPFPGILIPGPALGLISPGDDLDALSGPTTIDLSSGSFALLFSVDRETEGLAPPDELLIGLGVPYNALDQAARGQGAGDQFMSTEVFTLAKLATGRGRGLTITNTLVRNNYDEGGTDYSAVPTTHASDDVSRVPQDNVDATGRLPRKKAGGPVCNVYFSATAASPSLEFLPGGLYPSGANIYFNESPLESMPTTLYALHEDLQLVQQDDIDAMIVLDVNNSRIFDGPDRVLFSLAPGSPSLETISGASTVGAAADVFIVMPGSKPFVFVSAAELGLGAPTDNIDALDFVLCSDAFACALQAGIRAVPGDWDDDGDVDFNDFSQWPFCMTGPGNGLPPDGCAVFDFDKDMDVDLHDFARFQVLFTGTR